MLSLTIYHEKTLDALHGLSHLIVTTSNELNIFITTSLRKKLSTMYIKSPLCALYVSHNFMCQIYLNKAEIEETNKLGILQEESEVKPGRLAGERMLVATSPNCLRIWGC